MYASSCTVAPASSAPLKCFSTQGLERALMDTAEAALPPCLGGEIEDPPSAVLFADIMHNLSIQHDHGACGDHLLETGNQDLHLLFSADEFNHHRLTF